LFRVRGFTQDDAHLYVTPDQIEAEVLDCLDMLEVVYRALGFGRVERKLSTRPMERMGADGLWERAETALQAALERSDRAYEIASGEGAFYGPKIDCFLTDSLGRSWQCGTIQLDFQMPERFDLEYVGKDGARHRPVMVHRAIIGSLERMIGVIVEHYAGKLPVWLAPVQAIVLPISEKTLPYAAAVAERFRGEGLRAEIDRRPDKIGSKIRDALQRKIPYLLVAGEREEQSQTVAVRLRDGEDRGPQPVDAVVREIRERSAARGDASQPNP
ncbi:MAG: aminoacyl--tRNA ligase-related protein, partial [Planctomycetota bacterium]